MIVRLSPRGCSFKGLAAYLTHDPKAATDERVAWTHTLNLASDDAPGAVNEMLWTARDAELLKQEAGLRAGGRATDSTVKHISLNWSPEDDPSREHMIATTESFLHAMNWQEHQALLIAHDDKKYAHVHLMLNAIHLETGLCLDEGFEKRRAQAWAAGYERENGRIYCEQRFKDVREREDAPPRDAWLAFQASQEEFARSEATRRLEIEKALAAERDPKLVRQEEWAKLKELQCTERERYFAEGKQAFSELRSSIYGEVREQFRDSWSQYYTDREAGIDAGLLAQVKERIVAEQRELLAARRDEACAALRESRNTIYEALLDDQRQTRGELRGRQDEGWDNSAFFAALAEPRSNTVRTETAFASAAREVIGPADTPKHAADRTRGTRSVFDDAADAPSPVAAAGHLGEEVSFRVGKGAFSLFDIFFRAVDGPGTPPPTRSEREATNSFLAAADETSRREQKQQAEAEEDSRRRNQQALVRE